MRELLQCAAIMEFSACKEQYPLTIMFYFSFLPDIEYIQVQMESKQV